jgi:hypothetical protein
MEQGNLLIAVQILNGSIKPRLSVNVWPSRKRIVNLMPPPLLLEGEQDQFLGFRGLAELFDELGSDPQLALLSTKSGARWGRLLLSFLAEISGFADAQRERASQPRFGQDEAGRLAERSRRRFRSAARLFPLQFQLMLDVLCTKHEAEGVIRATGGPQLSDRDSEFPLITTEAGRELMVLQK